MQCAAAGAVARADLTLAAGKRTVVDSIYYQHAAPSANCGILTWVNASGNVNITSLSAGGIRGGVGATVGSATAALTVGQWYRIDTKIVVSGGTTTLDWWLDGVSQTQVSNAQADADITAFRIGINSAVTVTVSYMDHAESYTAGDAPLGQYRQRLNDLDTVVGANHSLGAGAFQKTGAVAITSGDSTSQTELTEKPLSSSQFVTQTTVDATAFLEYPVADTSETVAPALVRVAIGYTGAAANAYTMEVRAHDGTSEGTDLTTGVAKTSTTLHPLCITMTSPPSGGSWTLVKYQALKFRFGFSTDATPDPQLYGLAAMGVFPVAGGASVTGAFALTASPSLSFAGTRTRLAAFALTASPSLTFAGVRTRLGAFSIANAASTLSATGQRTRLGAFALTAVATLTDAGVVVRIGAFSLTNTASITVTGVRTRLGAFALTASPSLTFAGTRTRFAAFSLTASNALTFTGRRIVSGAFALAATSSLSATGGRLVSAAFSLAASATLTATGIRGRLSAFALTASSALQAAGERTAIGAFALDASASLVTAGQRIALGAFNMTATATLTVAGTATRFGAFALSALGSLIATGIKIWPLDNDPAEGGLRGHASERTLDGDPHQSDLDNSPD